MLILPALLLAPIAHPAPVLLAQVRIQQHIIVRVPRAPIPTAPMVAARTSVPALSWVERGSDRCIKLKNLAGAQVVTRDSVDLILNGGRRLRAKLARECPALAFYQGFYLKPTEDGKLCAERDTIRSRSGGACRIAEIKKLVPSR